MITVRLPELPGSWPRELVVAPTPPHIKALLAEFERRFPGLRQALDSTAVGAVKNGEVLLSGRDATLLRSGDEVEFLIMFAGG